MITVNEFIDLLKFLHGTGSSILPWIVLVALIYMAISLKPNFVKYIESRNEAKLEYIKKEGERNEIIRNCSATIEACTTALEMVSHDRQAIIEHVDTHENLSSERMEHIQTVVNQCRDEILKSRGDIKELKSKIDSI